MATSQTAEFTSDGTWTCPAGVTAVFVTMVGGGAGVNGNWGGGGGAGELMVGRPVNVVPSTVYSVTVGTKGLGAATETQPTLPGNSSFHGFTALGAQRINANPGFGANAAGIGGGVGGGYVDDNGHLPYRGSLEGCHYTGGGGGRGGNAGGASYGPGVHGGTIPSPGGAGNCGGAGAGSIWGGTDGATDVQNDIDASATHYGAGTTGNGATAGGQGGDGASGYVLLMWSS